MTSEGGAAGAGEKRANIFVSYSRKDAAFVDRLEQALITRGFAPRIDRSDIYAFEDWKKRIEELIVSADTIVFALSPDAVASDVCRWEVNFAAELGKRFAPIVARKVEDAAIPERLARLNFVFFDDEARFEEGADRLADALATDIGWIRKHTEFGELARRWALAGRPGPKGLLLRPPVLEEAERWIAARPAEAPMPTEATQAFIAESRRAETKRRKTLTASLGAGLAGALALAGLAAWQWREAEAQRARAEKTLALATQTADGLVFDLAQKFTDIGMPATLRGEILERARKLQEQLSASGAEKNAELQRSRAAALTETADSRLTTGDAKGALDAARESVTIAEALSTSDPSNAGWRRLLSVSHNKVGDALIAQGDLGRALKSYRDALAINEKLASSDAGNAEWRREAAVSYNGVGDILETQGDLVGALKAYRDSFAIYESLSASDPKNVRWRNNLTASLGRIGDVLKAQGDLAGALKAYRDNLVIAEKLSASDPANTLWRRNLSADLLKIGNVLVAQDDLSGALKAYSDGLAIFEKLSASDPGNAEWRQNSSVGYEKVGDVLKWQGNLSGALKAYRDNLAITEKLSASDPDNAEWQRALAVSYKNVGEVLLLQDDHSGARKAFRECLTILEKLSAADQTNAERRRDLLLTHFRVSLVDPANARAHLLKAQAIVRELTDAGKLAPSDANIPKIIDDALKALDAAPPKPAPVGGKRRK